MEENFVESIIQNCDPSTIGALPNGDPVAIVMGSKQVIRSLEEFEPQPRRISKEIKFDDLRGFVQYARDFKADTARAFANRERIKIVFDCDAPGEPRWGSHAITYAYRHSARWKLWGQANNRWLSQEEFADFLDSGLSEIAHPAHSDVLDLVKHFRATVGQDLQSNSDGRHFSYTKNVKGAARKTDIEMPEYLTVQVSPFDGLPVLNDQIADENQRIPAWAFRTKLSWRLRGDAEDLRPDFKVQILNFESAIEETLERLRGVIESLTGIITYIGG